MYIIEVYNTDQTEELYQTTLSKPFVYEHGETHVCVAKEAGTDKVFISIGEDQYRETTPVNEFESVRGYKVVVRYGYFVE